MTGLIRMSMFFMTEKYFFYSQADDALLRYGELLQKGEPTYHHVCLMSVYMKYVAAMKNENQLSSLKVKKQCLSL